MEKVDYDPRSAIRLEAGTSRLHCVFKHDAGAAMSAAIMAALWRGERTKQGEWLWPQASMENAIMPMRTKMLERIRLDPQAEYDAPLDVLEDVRLTFAQKQSVLESWELDARRLAEAAAEGMAGGEDSRLREVALARHALNEQDSGTLEKR